MSDFVEYRTVAICDDKARLTIPAKVRELIGLDEKIVFKLIYKIAENEIVLVPLGDTTTKDEKIQKVVEQKNVSCETL